MVERKGSLKKKKKLHKIPSTGRAYISAGFNNTLINITTPSGETICWGSPGREGFKGTRKSTPFAASVAAEKVAQRAVEMGVREVSVFLKGPGSGRDTAVKSLRKGGLKVISIADITPIPHNGCRPKKRRRV